MNFSINIDWKFVVALGTAFVGAVFAIKLDSSAVERVSIYTIDSLAEIAVARNSNC